MSERKIELSFGALSAPIRDQLKSQGLKPLPSKKCTDFWEKLHFSITMLFIQGFIPESTMDKCYKILRDRIMKELNK